MNPIWLETAYPGPIMPSERTTSLPQWTPFKPGRPGSDVGDQAVPWIYLVIAGLLEVAWAYFMKKSSGFTLLVPTALTLVTMIASFALLSLSMRTLPLGAAYTIWTGIGAVGAFVIGVVVLGEAATPMRWVAAAVIVAGIVLMKLSD